MYNIIIDLFNYYRYTESVIPTLTALHPSSIIDGLHSQCLDGLKRQNRLKKLKNKPDSDNRRSMPERQFSTDSRSSSGEMKTSSIQALFTLSKVHNVDRYKSYCWFSFKD